MLQDKKIGSGISALILCAGLVFTGAAHGASPQLSEVSAGTYDLEKSHASLIWRVSHKGLSKYTARFTDFDATLQFDPKRPTQSRVTARINPVSVSAEHPTKTDSWDGELANEAKWFNAKKFPTIEFTSTKIRKKGRNRGVMTGNLTFLGITTPVTLNVTFNGVANLPWFGERDVIGFSAHGKLRRSDFGMSALLPGIGDEVEIIIEAEFIHRTESPGNR